MTLDDADKIVHIWGRWLEFAYGKLHLIFLHGIPESFLPFPKDTLYKALDIMASNYSKTGDKHSIELMNNSAVTIHHDFVDNEAALINAAKDFNNPEWRRVFIPNFKEWQKEWIKTQGDFDGVYC